MAFDAGLSTLTKPFYVGHFTGSEKRDERFVKTRLRHDERAKHLCGVEVTPEEVAPRIQWVHVVGDLGRARDEVAGVLRSSQPLGGGGVGEDLHVVRDTGVLVVELESERLLGRGRQAVLVER